MKTTPLLLLSLAALFAGGNASARTQQCKPISEQQVSALFERWNKSVQSGDPQQVVANYAPKSVLLATLANKPLLTREDKLNYFTHFLEKKPSGKIDAHTVEIDCNTAVDAGLYTFTFGDGQQLQARFTYTYKWNGKKWLITSHHSSMLPERN